MPGKGFYQSGAFGPWMVTTDDIPDPATLTLITRLNGEEMQRATTDDLLFNTHLAVQGFYLLRARTQLREVVNVLLK